MKRLKNFQHLCEHLKIKNYSTIFINNIQHIQKLTSSIHRLFSDSRHLELRAPPRPAIPEDRQLFGSPAAALAAVPALAKKMMGFTMGFTVLPWVLHGKNMVKNRSHKWFFHGVVFGCFRCFWSKKKDIMSVLECWDRSIGFGRCLVTHLARPATHRCLSIAIHGFFVHEEHESSPLLERKALLCKWTVLFRSFQWRMQYLIVAVWMCWQQKEISKTPPGWMSFRLVCVSSYHWEIIFVGRLPHARCRNDGN